MLEVCLQQKQRGKTLRILAPSGNTVCLESNVQTENLGGVTTSGVGCCLPLFALVNDSWEKEHGQPGRARGSSGWRKDPRVSGCLRSSQTKARVSSNGLLQRARRQICPPPRTLGLTGGSHPAVKPGHGETPLSQLKGLGTLGRKPPSPYPNPFLSPPPSSKVQWGGVWPETTSSGSWRMHSSQGHSPLVRPGGQSSNFPMLEKQSCPVAAPELTVGVEQSRSAAMEPQVLLLVCTAVFLSASASPIAPADPIQVQEDFEEARIYGKWYAIALGTTCKWMKKYKERYLMGTLEVAAGDSSKELSVTSTRFRQGTCSQAVGVYQKSRIPGKYQYYNSRWETHVEGYVARTNYDEYAFLAWRKNSTYGYSVTTQLFGRSPHLPEDLIEEFRQFSVALGVPEDSFFRLTETGECVPTQPEVNLQRDRRSTWDEDAGSADGSPSFVGGNREDFCLQPRYAGPCLGMELRYFYNTTSQNCERFFYGGCRGNQNNFHSERDCLQTCRTEAACRLPIAPGEPCKDTFWAFDAKQGKCLTFQGCGRNANKFYLQKECQEYCGLLPSDGEEFLHQ